MSLPQNGGQEEIQATPVSVPAVRAGAEDVVAEVDLSSLLDLQDEREKTETRRSTRVILLSCGCLIVLFAVLCLVSSSTRHAFEGLVRNLEESRHDVEPPSGPKGKTNPVDRVLQVLGSRSTDVDEATRMLGTDPSTVHEDGVDPEMKKMMGGEGRTPGERQRLVENLARTTGVKMRKPTEPAANTGFNQPAVPAKPVKAADDAKPVEPSAPESELAK